MSRTTRALLPLALVLPMSLGASAALAQGADATLDQELTLTAIGGAPVASDAGITIVFASDGTLSGFGGCNSYSSTWDTEFETLTLTQDIQSTRKTCGDTIDALEAQYLGLLQAAASWSLDGTSLEITSADGSVLSYGGDGTGPIDVTPAPSAEPGSSAQPGSSVAPAGSIVGAWQMTEIAGQALPGGILDIDLTFADDGTLSGNGGCNDYTGEWSLSGTTIALTKLDIGTGGTCNATAQSLEQSFWGLLPFVDVAEVSDGVLSLVASLAGNVGFKFAPAD